jgi:hypothetical protein
VQLEPVRGEGGEQRQRDQVAGKHHLPRPRSVGAGAVGAGVEPYEGFFLGEACSSRDTLPFST